MKRVAHFINIPRELWEHAKLYDGNTRTLCGIVITRGMCWANLGAEQHQKPLSWVAKNCWGNTTRACKRCEKHKSLILIELNYTELE